MKDRFAKPFHNESVTYLTPLPFTLWSIARKLPPEPAKPKREKKPRAGGNIKHPFELVQECRRRYERGGETIKSLADEVGVDYITMRAWLQYVQRIHR